MKYDRGDGCDSIRFQQWVENLGHVGTLLFCTLESQNTFVVQGYVPIESRNSDSIFGHFGSRF